MSVPTPPPLPTAGLVGRLVVAERDCIVDWLEALRAVPGNPLDAAVGDFGGATAGACREVPAQVFNRVFGLTAADRDRVPAILAWYEQQGAYLLFDLNPYAIPPFWVEPGLPHVLAEHGFYGAAFHQLLDAVPSAEVPSPPGHIAIEEVWPERADDFVWVYEQVWGGGDAIRPLLGGLPFRCYLASVRGEVAALGVLHIANGVGSMANGLTAPEWRRRGCQTALLHRRIRDAALAGCDLLASQCAPGSVSQRNQVREGFHIAGSKVWWVSRPAATG